MGVDPTKVNAIVDEITANGGEAIASVGDIADMDYAESVVQLALDTYGDLDVLVAAMGEIQSLAHDIQFFVGNFGHRRHIDFIVPITVPILLARRVGRMRLRKRYREEKRSVI